MRRPVALSFFKTHQRVKVEQYIAFPWGIGLRTRTTLGIHRVTKEKKLSLGFAFLVLGNYVRRDLRRLGGGKTEPQAGRAIVDESMANGVCVRCDECRMPKMVEWMEETELGE